MRRLIICNDGTWNTPDDEDRGTRRPTNITKLSRAIKPVDEDGINQLTFYDEGVGTSWGQKLIGGITGLGLSENVLGSYRFLSNNYHQDDELYLFGFSRGAYTTRSLAGVLNAIGLVEKKDNYYIPELYRFYKDGADRATVDAFCANKNITVHRPRIRLIGVFDTVGSLGIPVGDVNDWIERLDWAELKFHDITLSSIVDYAYHALAIDEHRKPFDATLWKSATSETIEMEQRWFAGVHSNIGGGYKPDGLANLALHYIADKAQAVGLELDKQYLSFFEEHYDSELRNSMSLKYRLLGSIDRNITLGDASNQVIDKSVYERIKNVQGYQPDNIPQP